MLLDDPRTWFNPICHKASVLFMSDDLVDDENMKIKPPLGRIAPPKRMNFRESSKWPLTPPPLPLIFGKLYCKLFQILCSKNPVKRSKICNIFLDWKMTPPSLPLSFHLIVSSANIFAGKKTNTFYLSKKTGELSSDMRYLKSKALKQTFFSVVSSQTASFEPFGKQIVFGAMSPH